MNTSDTPRAELLRQQQRAHQVFTECLTGVPNEVKDAIVALYDLVRADLALSQGASSDN